MGEARVQLLPVLIALLAFSVPLLVAPRAMPSYFVIGQQKCGTSTLYALMNSHPLLKRGSRGGGGKEPRFFQKLHVYEYGVMHEICTRSVVMYMDLWKDLQEGQLAGDFTPAHISCYCCPELISGVAPNAKLISILRDPVSRSLSRFVEQWNWPFPMRGPLDQIIGRFHNFSEYAAFEIANLNKCLSAVEQLPPGDNDERLKWLSRYRCLARSNCIGWSAYSIFLKRWLEFFPKEQLLVLYTSELEANPEATIRKVEKFLGIEPHDYNPALLYSKFNSEKAYGWGAGIRALGNGTDSNRDAGGRLSDDDSEATGGYVKTSVASGQGYTLDESNKKSSAELSGDTSEMYHFIRPYMLELIDMASAGIIAQLPKEMAELYLGGKPQL